ESDERTQETARSANAFGRFVFRDLLGAANPERRLGSRVTVLQMLTEAESKVDRAFAGQPTVEASVRHSIGSLYLRLGRHRQAERHLRLAFEGLVRGLGRDHPETLASMANLGAALLWLERREEGCKLLTECWKLRREVHGPEHGDTLRTLGN